MEGGEEVGRGDIIWERVRGVASLAAHRGGLQGAAVGFKLLQVAIQRVVWHLRKGRERASEGCRDKAM